jgi:CheY-like chemotaxis protein
MSRETRSRVFEPFFTTKDPNGRPGLGLATVYGIVLQSGGHIGVESNPGQGARFTMHFPAATGDRTSRRSSQERLLRSSTGTTILVAEDNEGVRALTVRLLADAGYRVFEGSDGIDALETLKSLPEPVDLLISDVMMPRMNGSELAQHFHLLQPGTPVLLMSGYMDEDTVRRSFSEPDAVLAKPFTADALYARVRDLIGVPSKD